MEFFRGPSRQELLDAIRLQQEQIEGLRQMLQEQTLQIRQDICEIVKGELIEQSERLDARIWQSEENVGKRLAELSQSMDARIWQSEEDVGKRLEELNQNLDARIWQSEEEAGKRLTDQNKSLDARIWQLEEGIGKRLEELIKSIDARIWQSEEDAEKRLTEQNACLDARIWQSEEEFGKRLTEQSSSLDARIWRLEEGIGKRLEELIKSIDARIWQSEEDAEKRLTEQNACLDARIWQSEEEFGKRLTEQSSSLDARIWQAECFLKEQIIETDQTARVLDEVHRHIDFTYRDIMVALQRQKSFLPDNDIILETDYPVAYKSKDHLHPHGTIQDNTRFPRFVERCETLLISKRSLAFLDLGCSGGGMVLEAALRGHISMGLEGSDCSKKEQRAEWRLLDDRLQTCDITKPFYLRNRQRGIQQFDVITAWEVLEHIAEADLPQLFENIKNHLALGGYFVGSIANWDDIDPKSGVNWHITVHPYDWWARKFTEAGFQICTEDFATADMARGAYNPPQCYLAPADIVFTEKSFHIAVKNCRR